MWLSSNSQMTEKEKSKGIWYRKGKTNLEQINKGFCKEAKIVISQDQYNISLKTFSLYTCVALKYQAL